MNVDVACEINIARSRRDDSTYTANPDHPPLWAVDIQPVEWRTARPLQIGTWMAFAARFRGRRRAHVDEFIELVPCGYLVMRTTRGTVCALRHGGSPNSSSAKAR
jgi:hypothetical protein